MFCCQHFFLFINKCDKSSETNAVKLSIEMRKRYVLYMNVTLHVFMKEITKKHRGRLETEDNTSG